MSTGKKSGGSRKRGVVFSVLVTVGLHLLLPGIGLFAAVLGVLGGVTANRSLPAELTDPESWRKFQESHPESIKKGAKS